MAKDVITGEEKPGPEPALNPEGPSTPPAGGDTGEKFKFADREFGSADEAAKSYKEMQERARKAEQAAKDAAKRAETAESPIIQKLVDAQTKQDAKPGMTAADIQAIKDRKIQDLDERGNEAILDLLTEFSNDVAGDLGSKYEAEIAGLKKHIEELSGGFNEYRETSSEEYRQNKELIEDLMSEDGLTRQQAIKAAKRIRPVASALAAPAGTAPSGGSPALATGSGPSDIERSTFEMLAPDDLTAEEREKFEKGRK